MFFKFQASVPVIIRFDAELKPDSSPRVKMFKISATEILILIYNRSIESRIKLVYENHISLFFTNKKNWYLDQLFHQELVIDGQNMLLIIIMCSVSSVFILIIISLCLIICKTKRRFKSTSPTLSGSDTDSMYLQQNSGQFPSQVRKIKYGEKNVTSTPELDHRFYRNFMVKWSFQCID